LACQKKSGRDIHPLSDTQSKARTILTAVLILECRQMELVRALFVLLVAFSPVSCATSSSSPPVTGPEFHEGRRLARDFAKQDAMDFNCFIHTGRISAAQEASKHTKRLQDQGRSEAFIKGFNSGYKRYFPEFLDLYCESSRRFRRR
jgi:hypothetical protein